MACKSIVAHLDASAHSSHRLEVALRLANRLGAHLTALYSVLTPDELSFYAMAGTPAYVELLAKHRLERRDELQRLFTAELGRTHAPGQWIDADDEPARAVIRRGRYADLIVAGQDDPDDPDSYLGEDARETVVMSAGRPVLLVPYAGTFPAVGEQVMVAWNGSREATRKAAKHVFVFTVDGAKGEPPGSRIPGADIAAVIARHGVVVEVAAVQGVRDISVGELLLSRAADLGIDLIVMGAYSRSRWQEIVLGGVTRAMLESMTVPTVMSH